MPRPKLRYFAGLDLGQPHEFTALAVLERAQVEREEFTFAVRHLERFALGTPYGDIFDRLAELFAGPPLARGTLVVDQTGVSQPVLGLLRRRGVKADLRIVMVTAGHRATHEGGGWLVPKKDLIGVIQILLQERRLKLAPALPESQLLVDELARFRVKAVLAEDAQAPWREGARDDLVLALAVAAWVGEREKPTPAFVPYVLSDRCGRSR